MKKIMFVMLFLVFIAGCKDKEPTNVGPFAGGTDGVAISFVEGSPISEFVQGESVPVKILLNNNGEYDVKENTAQIKLYGLQMSDYGLNADYKSVTGGLRGVEKSIIEGGEQIIEMGNLNYKRSVAGFIESQLFAKVCYPYNTEARITACASSRSIAESGRDQVCVVEGEKAEEGFVSSAPIQVSGFTEELRGTNQVLFRIVVDNKGIGDVYNIDTSCADMDDAIKRADKLNIIKVNILPEDVSCSFLGQETNSGEIRLDQGTKTLVCTMDVEDTGASYEREIQVDLDYKYVETTSTQLKILEA